MAKIMELSYHLLTIHLLLLSLFSSSLAAKVPNSKTDLAALLSFKSQISDDPLGVLSSWNESLHHCKWPGVLCGRQHPDRVTALVLGSKKLSGFISPALANLTFLQNINFSDNHLQGKIPIELGYLHRLRFVDMSFNILEGPIPSTLGNCSKLEMILFNNNNLHGTIPSDLFQLKELYKIDLGNNFLRGDIPSEFGLFPKLYYLGLHVNNITGFIPSALGNLSSLEYLYLDQNNLGGNIPDSLGKLTNLLDLALQNNNFDGPISFTLGNLTKLLHLELHYNNLNGHIPLVLGNLTNLLLANLYQNLFSGSIPSTLGNLNNINILDLSINRLSGFIPSALGKLENLEYFIISSNSVSGEIPLSLYNISTMVVLDVGANYLKGTVPFDIGNVIPNLQDLSVYENQLSGQIPPSITNCSALYNLDVSDNYFSDIIPSTIGNLNSLIYFIVSGNNLEAKTRYEWSFIDSLANCTYLKFLDLSGNQLQGTMPNSITNLSTSLLGLNISYNPIYGSIPTELSKLTNLGFLLLNNMFLSGIISEKVGDLFKLEIFDVSFDSLSGQIPQNFGNLTQLTQLFLNDNTFEGSIPSELVNMQYLEILNLSNNRLTGEISKEIMTLPSLSISLDLSHNYLTYILPPEIGNLKNLQSIRLSNNKLFGEIPNTIGGCQLLQDLYLDNNLFQGTIPSTLSNLRGLQVLDLSNNSLSGQVLEFIGRMNLQYLNISFNNFEGELPRIGIFMNVTGLDVRGNPMLCGGVPKLNLPQCPSKYPTWNHHFHRSIMLISSIVSFVIGLVVVIWLSVTCCSRKISDNNQQSTDRALKHELAHVSYNDLLKATDNFSFENLIGEGSFGKVYKVVISFENETIVAVKVLNLERYGAIRSFFSECEILRNVRHRNLIKVLSSCSSIDHQGKDFKALVFEYMPYGSLEALLHPNSNIDPLARSLNLSERLNIAIDVATALDYLHSHGPTPIVHCDLKPSNVLLDGGMIAKVGDFGLARFLVHSNTLHFQSMTSTNGINGSIGYIPPEYGMGGRPSTEGDVYSYGILLIEMFTGVRPTDERFGYGLSLRKHVEMALPEHITDVVDSKLFSQSDGEDIMFAPENVHGCLVLVLRCGLLCSKESPQERIAVQDVLKELELARKKLLIRP